MLAGTALALWLFPGSRRIARVRLDIHTLLFAVVAVLIGFQSMIFALFTKVFAITQGCCLRTLA